MYVIINWHLFFTALFLFSVLSRYTTLYQVLVCFRDDLIVCTFQTAAIFSIELFSPEKQIEL